jgi:hypothetical protein
MGTGRTAFSTKVEEEKEEDIIQRVIEVSSERERKRGE